MINVSADVPRQPIQRLLTQMDRVQDIMGKLPEEMLPDVAARFFVGVRKRTTLGRRKKRQIVKNPKRRETYTTRKGTQRTRTIKSEPRYLILKQKAGKPVEKIPTDSRKDARAVINTRGLGRDTWSHGLAKLGRPRGRTIGPRRASSRLIRVQQRLGGFNPSITITNRAGYIEATSRRAVPAAMSAVARYLRMRTEQAERRIAARATA